jgi:hypothetical protein
MNHGTMQREGVLHQRSVMLILFRTPCKWLVQFFICVKFKYSVFVFVYAEGVLVLVLFDVTALSVVSVVDGHIYIIVPHTQKDAFHKYSLFYVNSLLSLPVSLEVSY